MKVLTLRQASILRDGLELRTDIQVRDGRITRVGQSDPEGEVVDLDGLWVLPGAIDAHVHARDPGATHKEDFHSASEAALAGGVTSLLDMPNNAPPTTGPEPLQEKRQLASAKCLVHYGFLAGATPDNVRTLNALPNLAAIKVYLGSTTGELLIEDPADFARIVAEAEKLLVVHAESEPLLRLLSAIHGSTRLHHRVRDNVAAAVAVAECVALACAFRKPIHIAHVTTQDELAVLRGCRDPLLTCEASPHHLFLDQDYFVRHGNLGKVNPPLRTSRDIAALWDGIRDGTVDLVASDHAPHTLQEKARDYPQAPSGVPGLQTLLPLMVHAVLDGRLGRRRLEELLCERPAAIFGMRRKGLIEPGYDADLCVVDPNGTTAISNATQRSRCGWTPWDGWTLKGAILMTFVGGRLAYRDGQILTDEPGQEIEFAPRAG